MAAAILPRTVRAMLAVNPIVFSFSAKQLGYATLLHQENIKRSGLRRGARDAVRCSAALIVAIEQPDMAEKGRPATRLFF